MRGLDWSLLGNNTSKDDLFIGPLDPEEFAAVIALYKPDPVLWARVQSMAALGVSHLNGLYNGVDAAAVAGYWRALSAAGMFFPDGVPCIGARPPLPPPNHRIKKGVLKGMCAPRFKLLTRGHATGGFAYTPRQPTEHDQTIVAERRRRRIDYVERGDFAHRRGSE